MSQIVYGLQRLKYLLSVPLEETFAYPALNRALNLVLISLTDGTRTVDSMTATPHRLDCKLSAGLWGPTGEMSAHEFARVGKEAGTTRSNMLWLQTL